MKEMLKRIRSVVFLQWSHDLLNDIAVHESKKPRACEHQCDKEPLSYLYHNLKKLFFSIKFTNTSPHKIFLRTLSRCVEVGSLAETGWGRRKAKRPNPPHCRGEILRLSGRNPPQCWGEILSLPGGALWQAEYQIQALYISVEFCFTILSKFNETKFKKILLC